MPLHFCGQISHTRHAIAPRIARLGKSPHIVKIPESGNRRIIAPYVLTARMVPGGSACACRNRAHMLPWPKFLISRSENAISHHIRIAKIGMYRRFGGIGPCQCNFRIQIDSGRKHNIGRIIGQVVHIVVRKLRGFKMCDQSSLALFQAVETNRFFQRYAIQTK